DTLLPWAEQEYGAGADAARTVVAGQSAGGLTAAFAAFQRPGAPAPQLVGNWSAVLIRLLISAPDSVSTPLLL
ncbi:hypothetical protein ACFC5E_03705, partial [Streptomyces rochei]|uniref:hypothetical protein n=1 Tax=Streptomyces rochei TaxID=1928 RepID=UPI0035E0A213